MVAAAALVCAAPACAQNLKQIATIAIPGTPLNQFAGLTIDQSTGLGYLADKDNNGVVVFDSKTNTYVTRIGGFVGTTKDGNAAGPNGVLVVKDGAELWVSDGDSTIKVVDLKTNQITATIPTGGKLRANGMAYDPKNQVVIVAVSNDDPPFLAVISTAPGHKIIAKIPVPQSAENLERSAFHAPSGMFYTAIPVLSADQSKGILAQTESATGKLVKLHELERCYPHSLSIVSDTTIFLGCSAAHGPNRKPGGDMAIFDITSAKIVDYRAGAGGNGSSTANLKLGQYYHATTNAALVVVDIKSREVAQKVQTWNGARSVAANTTSNRVFVATTAKDGPCGGCIAVFGAE
jgi:YVTN family beta-propeller protein